MVAGNEIAAWVADDRHVYLANLFQDVFAIPIGVGKFRVGLVDTFIDCSAEMLQEGAKQIAIKRGLRAPRVDIDLQRLRAYPTKRFCRRERSKNIWSGHSEACDRGLLQEFTSGVLRHAWAPSAF